MKTLFRLLGTIMLTLLIVGIQVAPVRASSHTQELTYNPEAETYVRAELLADGDVDLVAGGFTTEAERTVRAEFIVSLWQDPAYQEIPFFKLRHAVIAGDLEAEGLSIPFNVEFHFCTFNGRVNMESTDTKTFRIDDSTIKGTVRMGRMAVDGDLALYNSTFGGIVTLFDANISNNLFAKGSKFLATVPDPNSAYPFELWKTQVGQSTEFSDVVIMGDVMADDAKFKVDVNFDGAIFTRPASFKNIQVGNLADFQAAHFKDKVTFQSSIIERDISFSNAIFDGDADFDFLNVKNFSDFDGIIFNGRFSVQYSVLSWPYFEATTFKAQTNFEGMQASNELDFTNATYTYLNEPFTLNLVKVDKAVRLENFTSPAGLQLANNQLGDLNISGKDSGEFPFIVIDSIVVDGDFVVENIDTKQFVANDVTVTKSSTFRNMSVAQSMDISNDDFGHLKINQLNLPPTVSSVNLHGTTYTDITINDGNRAQDTWDKFLSIIDYSVYDAQVYKTYTQFLTDKGNPDLASKVELARKRRERSEIIPYSGPWIWSWFLDIFAGYGILPYRALLWSLFIIGTGTLVFRKETDLVILDMSETKPPYNPILYSFALFLPFIDLGIASKWEPRPSRRAAWMYKHIHRLLGWILMPIALLTFSGIIK